MITSLETLRSDRELRALLLQYSALHKKEPKLEWHDRVMELEGCEADRLVKLHGLLLASGWIETRVHGDSFRQAGRLEACYRITTDGVHALRLTESATLEEEEVEESTDE